MRLNILSSRFKELIRYQNWLRLSLTWRGVFLLTFLSAILFGPALNQDDIIAHVVCFGLGILSILIAAFVYSLGVTGKRRYAIDIETPSYDSVFSQIPTRLILRFSEFKIPGLLFFKIKIRFEDGQDITSWHYLEGRQDFVFEDITFPHRGLWSVDFIDFEIGDRFGISRFCFKSRVRHSCTIKVRPAKRSSTFPVISSSDSRGDTLSDVAERQGDPLDLKQYHPSDGLKRILWKVYAKSGELIARHPERSMTPEGQVAIWAFASPQDDGLSGALVYYLDYLNDLGLEVYFGCKGMGNSSVARTAAQAEELLIETVWAQRNSNALYDLFDYHEQLQRNFGGNLKNVLVFLAVEYLSSESHKGEILSFGQALAEMGIQPIFVLQDSLPGRAPKQRKSGILPYLIFDETVEPALNLKEKFVQNCLSANWQVVVQN